MGNAQDRIVGWRLARQVAASPLYHELGPTEQAECDELLARGSPAESGSGERTPAGVPCRLARCNYRGDCERPHYCQAAILQADTYRRILRDEALPVLRRMAKELDAGADPSTIRASLDLLTARVNRNI